jgi:hypothetical protein
MKSSQNMKSEAHQVSPVTNNVVLNDKIDYICQMKQNVSNIN